MSMEDHMAKELKTSPSGRMCAFPHCTHILSIYNHETYCHIHRDKLAQLQKAKMQPHFDARPQTDVPWDA